MPDVMRDAMRDTADMLESPCWADTPSLWGAVSASDMKEGLCPIQVPHPKGRRSFTAI
jgi:hypothetical protein